MNYFRQLNRRTLLLWSLLLSLALLCAQGATLHIHSDQTHNGDHDHIAAPLNKPHSALDISHNEHHDGSEIDLSADGLLKNTLNKVFTIALFTLFFTLLIFSSSRQFTHHYRKNKLILYSYYLFSPPLRAPPQH